MLSPHEHKFVLNWFDEKNFISLAKKGPLAFLSRATCAGSQILFDYFRKQK